MTSVLISPDGYFEAEAAHGTVTRHYREWQKGNETSTNPIASIFAWTRGLHQRAVLDKNGPLKIFCEKLEEAVIGTVRSGHMTKDLALSVYGSEMMPHHYMESMAFLDRINDNFKMKLDEAGIV